MRGSFFVGADHSPKFEVREMTFGPLGPRDVLVNNKACGICGTDVHIYNWDPWAQEHIKPPMVIGHEYVGEVAELGAGVTGLRVGQRVSGEGHITCGRCRNCHTGNIQWCKDTKGVGVDRDGAFAEYVCIPESNVIIIDESLDEDVVAFFDAFGNATHTALMWNLVGEDVLITGAGPIGIIAVGQVRNPNGVTNLGDNYYQAGEGSGGLSISLLGGALVGCLLGAIAGYFGGVVDTVIMRFNDILMAIPRIVLAISIASALGPGLTNAMIAVAISSVPNFARIVRASTLTIKDQEYIEAAHCIEAKNSRIIFCHIFPNVLAPIIVQATLGVGTAIILAASLSFLGLGVQPPTPEWGSMLSAARTYMRDYPYMVIFPGLAIMVTVLALNLFGDGLRDALDPKLKK